jgi:hypothetical protein
VGAVDHVADVATALATSVDRASTASQTGAKAAARRQQRAEARLSKQLEAALRAKAKRGTKLATILRREQFGGTLTEAQASQATDLVLADLAQQGFADVSVLGAALTPHAHDLLALLSQP